MLQTSELEDNDGYHHSSADHVEAVCALAQNHLSHSQNLLRLRKHSQPAQQPAQPAQPMTTETWTSSKVVGVHDDEDEEDFVEINPEDYKDK